MGRTHPQDRCSNSMVTLHHKCLYPIIQPNPGPHHCGHSAYSKGDIQNPDVGSPHACAYTYIYKYVEYAYVLSTYTYTCRLKERKETRLCSCFLVLRCRSQQSPPLASAVSSPSSTDFTEAHTSGLKPLNPKPYPARRH